MKIEVLKLKENEPRVRKSRPRHSDREMIILAEKLSHITRKRLGQIFFVRQKKNINAIVKEKKYREINNASVLEAKWRENFQV